jgi:hypothetical protein
MEFKIGLGCNLVCIRTRMGMIVCQQCVVYCSIDWDLWRMNIIFVIYPLKSQITEVRKNTLPSARGVGVGQMV